MKVWNFENIFFRLNISLTILVFSLLTPATRVFGAWFPDRREILWLLPLAVITASSLIWFALSMSLPWLIKKGFFEDRRGNSRKEDEQSKIQVARIAGNVFNLFFHLVLVVLFCYCVTVFMKTNPWEALFRNVV